MPGSRFNSQPMTKLDYVAITVHGLITLVEDERVKVENENGELWVINSLFDIANDLLNTESTLRLLSNDGEER